MSRFDLLTAACCACLLILPLGHVGAADFFVDTLASDGPGSLRQAISDANSSPLTPHRILFEPALSGAIEVGSTPLPELLRETEIAGPASGEVRVDFEDGPGIVISETAQQVILQDLQLSNGRRAQGGCLHTRSELTLTRMRFVDCFAEGAPGQAAAGGAIHTIRNLTIVDSEFLANAALGGAEPALGGALFIGFDSVAADVTIEGSTFGANSASSDRDAPGAYSQGGAIRHRAGILTVLDSVFVVNSALEEPPVDSVATGGAIHSSFGALRIERVTFARNISGGSGSAVYIFHSNTDSRIDTLIENVQFLDNQGNLGERDNNGATLAAGRAFMSLRGTTFAGNRSSRGASSLFHGSSLENLAVSHNAFARSADGSPACFISSLTTPDSEFVGQFNAFTDDSCSWLAASGTSFPSLGLVRILHPDPLAPPRMVPVSQSPLTDGGATSSDAVDFSDCAPLDLLADVRPQDGNGDSLDQCTIGAFETPAQDSIFSDGWETP